MPDPHLLDGHSWRLLECFSIATLTNGVAQACQTDVPTARIYIARCFYAGLTGAAIAGLGIHFYGAENSTWAWTTSFAAGFQTNAFLAAVWNTVFAGAASALYKKVTGNDLVGLPKACEVSEPPHIEPSKVVEVDDETKHS